MKLSNGLPLSSSLPVACLFATVISAAGAFNRFALNRVAPLGRPGALGASSAEDVVLQQLRQAPIKDATEQKGDDKKGVGVDPNVKPMEAPAEAVKPEGEDPAVQAQREAAEAAKAVPETLPPTEQIRDMEAEAAGKNAAELTGVKPNEHGDLSTFVVALSVNATIVAIAVLIFSFLRMKVPMIYSHNVEIGIAPMTPTDSFFGWISASLSTTTEMAGSAVGLDAAMLLEFCNMSIKIMATIGIPMVCIMCPLHLFFGGGGLGIDALSAVAMGNVIVHHPWLYYVHAVVVNLVTFAIVHIVYDTMENFLKLRYGWLKCLPAPRCITVLVEGIPPQWRSDSRLREFFSALFHPNHIKEAVMVKKAKGLQTVYNEQKEIEAQLLELNNAWEKDNFEAEKRPLMSEQCFGAKVDAIKHYQDKLSALMPKVDEARAAARKESEEVGGMNTSTGFVTFHKRRQAVMCERSILSTKRSEWIVSAPPPASDVLWEDLKQDERQQKGLTFVAYACVVAIYAFFIPVVILGTNLTALVDVGYFQPLWASFAPGLALMLALGFLPTVLLLVFRSFFTLKSDTMAQHKLQVWYFAFLVFFVILVTCIGKNVVNTFSEIVRQPETLMWTMAKEMPTATHFYMDFLMLQWGEQAVNFMRHVPLAKFILFKMLGHEPEAAKDLCEPEDQDYYGIGSRSARFTVSILIGIIFSTLSPLVAILCLVLFCLNRLFYGYIIVFAETKKADLGGFFFFTKLQHVLLGTGIYNVLMIGVLCFRARTMFPMLLASPSLVYTVANYMQFSTNFVWEDLPFTEVCFHQDDEEMALHDNGLRYMQPEFIDADTEKEIASQASGLSLDALLKSRHSLETLMKRARHKNFALNTPRFMGEEGESLPAGSAARD